MTEKSFFPRQKQRNQRLLSNFVENRFAVLLPKKKGDLQKFAAFCKSCVQEVNRDYEEYIHGIDRRIKRAGKNFLSALDDGVKLC